MTTLPDVLQSVFSLYIHEEWEPALFSTLLIVAWIGIPVYCLIKARKNSRLVMLMRCLPTSKVKGVFLGLTEVKGEAILDPPLISYLAGQACVWYTYTIEEEWRRVETETYRDSNGNIRTRTVVRSGWTTVAEGSSMEGFYLQDDTGSILVWPEGATLEGGAFMDRTCGVSNPLYYGKGPAGAIPHSTYKRRFSEQGIPVKAMLYIIGTTRERTDAIHPEFAEAGNKDPYLISMQDEETITKHHQLITRLLLPLSIVILMAPSFLEDAEFPCNLYNPDHPFLQQSIWLHTTVIFTTVWLVWMFWQWYSEMVAARNRVKQGAAQVEVQIQRRHDLIRQLVDVVEAYCSHEQTLLEQVAELRSQVEQGGVSMLAEAYPDLKASTLFSKLQKELADTEERLALAREYLNTIGNFYNTCLQVFPGGLILRLFGFTSFRRDDE